MVLKTYCDKCGTYQESYLGNVGGQIQVRVMPCLVCYKEAVVTQPTANNTAMDVIAKITSVLDDGSKNSETKVTLINIIVGQLHQ